MLRRQLDARGGPPGGMNLPPQHAGPSQQPPPNIGVGNNVFGAIMSGQGGQGGGLAPPPPPQPEQQPPHMAPNPPGLQVPPPPPPPPPQHQPPFQQQYPQGPPPSGFSSQPPQHATASPGPGKRAIGRPPAGNPATPRVDAPIPYGGPGQSPQVPTHPTPDARMGQHQLAPPVQTNSLSDLDPERLPGHVKKQKDDWWAVFNQAVTRVLDVDLVHTLQHESVVCCVRFSADGKYVATGCNRSAQIYDVATGEKICILQDESIDLNGDLYIRSVCFSPDGKYLATGAEDKLIRVRIRPRPILAIHADLHRSGILLPSKFGTRSMVTNKIFTRSTSHVTAELLLRAAVTVRFVSGILRPGPTSLF